MAGRSPLDVFPDRLQDCINKKKEKEGITQNAIAEKLGEKPATLSKWATGSAKPDNFEKIMRLVSYFNVSADWLLGLARIDVRSTNPAIRKIADLTRLSSDAIERLNYNPPFKPMSPEEAERAIKERTLPPRAWTDEEIEKISGDWALTGKKKNRNHHIITSLELEAHRQEVFNEKLQRKYREIEANEVRYEALNCEDADYIFVAYGSCARICQKSIQLARQEGIKVGLLRPITLYPFPTQAISDLCAKTKGFLSIEMSAGQMVEDVRLAVNGRVKVDFYGRMGGVVPTPEEIVEALKNKFKI